MTDTSWRSHFPHYSFLAPAVRDRYSIKADDAGSLTPRQRHNRIGRERNFCDASSNSCGSPKLRPAGEPITQLSPSRHYSVVTRGHVSIHCPIVPRQNSSGNNFTGINFLPFRRLKTYTHLRPTEPPFLSRSVMGPSGSKNRPGGFHWRQTGVYLQPLGGQKTNSGQYVAHSLLT